MLKYLGYSSTYRYQITQGTALPRVPPYLKSAYKLQFYRQFPTHTQINAATFADQLQDFLTQLPDNPYIPQVMLPIYALNQIYAEYRKVRSSVLAQYKPKQVLPPKFTYIAGSHHLSQVNVSSEVVVTTPVTKPLRRLGVTVTPKEGAAHLAGNSPTARVICKYQLPNTFYYQHPVAPTLKLLAKCP